MTRHTVEPHRRRNVYVMLDEFSVELLIRQIYISCSTSIKSCSDGVGGIQPFADLYAHIYLDVCIVMYL